MPSIRTADELSGDLFAESLPVKTRGLNDGPEMSQRTVGICVVLALVTVALYWPVTGHQFLNFDDHTYITENPHVQAGLTWSGVLWAFQGGYAGNWHPLTWLSHMLDCQLYGLNPAGHHFTNVLFHVANTLLLFVALKRMTGAQWRSAFVAALFAWHPLHVESVAWASERKDVLSTFFWLLAMLAYLKYVKRQSRGRYALTLVLFVLGLMSKPMVVTLPFVLLLLDFWPLQRIDWSAIRDSRLAIWRLVREKLPFFVLAAVSCVVTLWAQQKGGAVSSMEIVPLQARIANALVAYLRYIGKTLWPTDLAAIYLPPRHWLIGPVIAAAFVLVALSVLFLLRVRRQPYLATGWFWFLGTLVPTIGLVQVGLQSMADRYMYIPSIGLFILVVWGATGLLGSWPQGRAVLAGIGVAVLAGCLVSARLQLRYWENGERLFRHAIEVTTDNCVAYNALGNALDSLGRKAEAMAAFVESVRLDPRFPDGRYNLGRALLEEGRVEEARAQFTEALALKPDHVYALINLGNMLLRDGQLNEAHAYLEKAVRLKPDYPEAHYNLGTLLLMQSKLDEAAAQFTEAVKLRPNYADAHGNLGVALIRQGNLDQGIVHLSEAVRLGPGNAGAHFNLGLALMEQGRLDEAAGCFRQTLLLKPDYAMAHYRLAWTLARQHKSSEAIPHYREALRLQPDFADALNELAEILSSNPDPVLRDGIEAVRLAERACRLTQNQQAGPMAALAAAYAEVGVYSEAVTTAQKARELALATGQKEIAIRCEEMLKLFQSGRPFRSEL